MITGAIVVLAAVVAATLIRAASAACIARRSALSGGFVLGGRRQEDGLSGNDAPWIGQAVDGEKLLNGDAAAAGEARYGIA